MFYGKLYIIIFIFRKTTDKLLLYNVKQINIVLEYYFVLQIKEQSIQIPTPLLVQLSSPGHRSLYF